MRSVATVTTVLAIVLFATIAGFLAVLSFQEQSGDLGTSTTTIENSHVRSLKKTKKGKKHPKEDRTQEDFGSGARYADQHLKQTLHNNVKCCANPGWFSNEEVPKQCCKYLKQHGSSLGELEEDDEETWVVPGGQRGDDSTSGGEIGGSYGENEKNDFECCLILRGAGSCCERCCDSLRTSECCRFVPP